jgi:hypothetical protein
VHGGAAGMVQQRVNRRAQAVAGKLLWANSQRLCVRGYDNSSRCNQVCRPQQGLRASKPPLPIALQHHQRMCQTSAAPAVEMQLGVGGHRPSVLMLGP